MVDPMGSTKRTIRGSISNFSSRHFIEIGRVAELKQGGSRKREGRPGGGSKGRQQGLDHAAGETEGIFPGTDEVDEGEDDDGVDEEADDNGHHVEAEEGQGAHERLHLKHLAADEEQYPDRRVPHDDLRSDSSPRPLPSPYHDHLHHQPVQNAQDLDQRLLLLLRKCRQHTTNGDRGHDQPFKLSVYGRKGPSPKTLVPLTYSSLPFFVWTCHVVDWRRFSVNRFRPRSRRVVTVLALVLTIFAWVYVLYCPGFPGWIAKTRTIPKMTANTVVAR